jgi:hypothetical protein
MKKSELKTLIKECIIEEGLVQEDSVLREQRMMASMRKGLNKYKYKGNSGFEAAEGFMVSNIPDFMDYIDTEEEFLEQLLYDDNGPAFELTNTLIKLGAR